MYLQMLYLRYSPILIFGGIGTEPVTVLFQIASLQIIHHPLSIIFLANCKLTALNGVIPGFSAAAAVVVPPPPPPKLGTNSGTFGLRAPPSFLAAAAAAAGAAAEASPEGSLAGGASGQESGLCFGRN